MQVEPGQSLLHYRIVDKLGEGGMGVVWRAVDTTLDREVAIKVLPEGLAADPERLARFEREAKLLAAVNHPNIAEIYGLHAVGETRFIAMELVAGEDLAQRLSRGALPQHEVLEIAKQVARALEVAHEQGVIHRDLKPANVQMTPDGRIKVLDFGLAKALQPDPASGEANPSLSPTVTSLGATQAGMILGTAAYMAPEQARGHAADKRADIWALGCMLYEMLSGRATFAGDTVSDTLASVLKSEPDWDALPEQTDPALRLLLERCLDKDVRQRMRDVGEVRIAAERILGGDASGLFTVAAPGAAPAERTGARWPVVAGLMVLAAVMAGAAGWLLRPTPEAAAPVVRRFEIVTPGLRLASVRAPVLSPDGRRVAYVTNGGIQVRDLDRIEPRRIEGSEDAETLMWSPDGEQLGWQSDGRFWRAAVNGGSKSAICDVPARIYHAEWGPDDRILLTPDDGPLYEVPARGGDPQPILHPVEGEDVDFHSASFLPGGRGLILVRHRTEESMGDTLEVVVDGERKEILRIEEHGLGRPRVAASGHLLYTRWGGNDGLWAAPFSLERLELTGDPVLIDPEGVAASISADGSLLYSRTQLDDERQLVRVDREGRELEALAQPQNDMMWPAVSPDGRTVAVSADGGDGSSIWLHDLARGTRTRLTFESDRDWAPAWYPDGQRVALGRERGPAAHLVAVATDGSGRTIQLGQGELPHVSATDGSVVFELYDQESDDDLFVIDGDASGEAVTVVETPQGEEHAQISPDGMFVAYKSDDSGRDEVYIKRFPSGEGRWQASVNGGNWPRWNPAGGELFFVQESDLLMAVDVTPSPAGLSVGNPRELFSIVERGYFRWLRCYDAAPDGKSFVMMRGTQQVQQVPTLTFVENWVEGLR
jgi:Tol biopolymer transport system component